MAEEQNTLSLLSTDDESFSSQEEARKADRANLERHHREDLERREGNMKAKMEEIQRNWKADLANLERQQKREVERRTSDIKNRMADNDRRRK